MGRVVKEPEVSKVGDGKRVINLRIAVSRSFKNVNGEIETDFFSVAFWDFQIDFIMDNLKKGMPVLIKGRLQMGPPQEIASGHIISFPTIIGERIMLFTNDNEKK